jgi:ferrochelatase
MPSPDRPLGVLLMTYGSPSSLDDVERYMTAVRGGRAPEPGLLTEFRRRYGVIGGSPLVEITRRQAAAVERALGDDWRVRAAMRFSAPTIADALRELGREGVAEAVGIVMSPQYSPLLMGGYGRAVEAARIEVGEDAPDVAVAGDWYREPGFVEALGSRVREAIERLPSDERPTAPVLLTAHSLPRRVAEQEPDYLRQLSETAELVAASAGIADGRWRFCWQSAGHEPGEWMKPDFADLMPELAAEGHRSVVVAPVQFLADHLEILYDVDVGAREQAEAAGLRFERIRSLNDDPTFVAGLASVARGTLSTPAGR